MANIRTKSDQRAGEKALMQREHKNCRTHLFGQTKRNGAYDAERGDVKVCPHGILMEYRGRHAWEGILVREITPKRHPILYMKAKKAIALEERLRQEERDSDGGS